MRLPAMRLRYLDTDFFQEAAENATRRFTRSILHVCSLGLQQLEREDASSVANLVLASCTQQADQRPLQEIPVAFECLNPQARIRDKLLQNLLPFKQESEFEVSCQLPEALPTSRQAFVLETLEVDFPEEMPAITDLISSQVDVRLEETLTEEAVLLVPGLDLQQQKLQLTSSIQSLGNTEADKMRKVLLLETLQLDFPEQGAVQVNHVITDLAASQNDIPLKDGWTEESTNMDEVFLQTRFLVKETLPAAQRRTDLDELSDSSNCEMLILELVMVSDEDWRPLLWDPRTIARTLAVQSIELDLSEDLLAPQLYEKLVLTPELSLRCQLFKFLPVPTFLDSQRQERVEESILGSLASIAKCSQPSATDFIYLDWHLSQGNNCNDQRCFYFRSHHQCAVPDKIPYSAAAGAPQLVTESSDNFLDGKAEAGKANNRGVEARVSLDVKMVPSSFQPQKVGTRIKESCEGIGTRFVSENDPIPGPATQRCSGIFVANIRLIDKHGVTSRRSTYQKILNLEKDGAQVVEREMRLPIDVILNPMKCLVLYSTEKLGLLGQKCNLEAISTCIESIIDNDLKAISFGFKDCIMVFEGDRMFTSAILQNVDDIYAAAVGLNIYAQCFVSSDPASTEAIISGCVKEARENVSSNTFPRMAEASSVAEAFLTESPAINPLTAHAILSSGKALSAFIAMSLSDQLLAVKPFNVPRHSLELFKAQSLYGELERPRDLYQAVRIQNRSELRPAEQLLAPESGRGQRHFKAQDGYDHLEEYDRRQPVQSFHPTFLQQKEPPLEPVEQCLPYFPPAGELSQEWFSEEQFNAGPYFPPASQLDEDWDESPGFAEAHVPAVDSIVDNSISQFGFSTNRRQSSSSASVKDALQNWLCAREQNKKNLKRPPTAAAAAAPSSSYQQQQQRGSISSSTSLLHETAAAPSAISRKKKDGGNAASKENSAPTAATFAATKKKNKKSQKNDIFSLWENFKHRNSPQIQAAAATPLYSNSFKRPAPSSIYSSPNSFTSVQQQPKRTKRITI